MIEYRPFINTDAPLLAEIWRSQSAQRGLLQPMSAALFESLVLAKPIFDRLGLILALEDGKPLGFVHAGFGANADKSGLNTELGVIGMLLMRAPDPDPAVAAELLRRSEQYLQSRGATAVLAGGNFPANPFYLGLYGGCAQSGILTSDTIAQSFFQQHGYQEVCRSSVLHRELARFRPIVDRQQMQIRRRTSLSTASDPPASSWWDACTFGSFDRTVFDLQSRDGGQHVARARFWNMELLATTWGVHAAGVVDLEVADSERRQGLATYLMGEAFRTLHAEGTALVEAQVPLTNVPCLALFKKLGFEEVDQAVGYRKDFAKPAT